MVLDGSQQQLQSVVIDQGHSYQSSGQQQQFGTLVQNVDLSNQTGQQVFFMENSNSRGETVQAVEQVSYFFKRWSNYCNICGDFKE